MIMFRCCCERRCETKTADEETGSGLWRVLLTTRLRCRWLVRVGTGNFCPLVGESFFG